ncbi:hypothetical protein FA15DRAFT_664924 [Coprinopsis marcescibilis]|uniref:Vacuolar ATPase assembly integral membrane protein VMA21 n=1 Tax=Coprinopsis marcescibilis TaxID=230819 RepID=A0A5C3LA07_COPMA|nr:hypothetical protein FA15DRAFT_664924 [Coprinopsis marcescibilis]
MNAQQVPAKINTQAAQGGVLLKLILFSLSLGVIPLSAYYSSLKYFWEGNTIYAAVTAIVAANLILVAYIITAVVEDRAKPSDTTKSGSESKKEK